MNSLNLKKNGFHLQYPGALVYHGEYSYSRNGVALNLSIQPVMERS